jgi:hypothetical protein
MLQAYNLQFDHHVAHSFLQAADKEKIKRDAEEMGDAMKALENRAMDSKQDMDILAALEEMRSMKVGSSSRPLAFVEFLFHGILLITNIVFCAVCSLDMLVSLLTRCLKF